ncbi:MAG: hypothetical protein WCQ03_05885 [Phycisphaerae bacterium]
MSSHKPQPLQEQLTRQIRLTHDWHSFRTLSGLLALLERAGTERLPSAIAESLIALRLIRAGFSVEADVPTPNGKSCDFRASRRGESMCVHVKRLSTSAHETPAIPTRIRSAIVCRRKVRAELWWSPNLETSSLARLGRSFNAFLREAAIGESLSVRDAPNIEIGRIRIHRPTARQMELRVERADRVRTLDRIERLTLRAFEQCMPRSSNVIALVGDHATDWELFDVALHGTFVERWDRVPNQGERRAYGRDDDGLWTRHRAPWCELAASLTVHANDSDAQLSQGILLTREEDARPDAAIQLARRGLLRSHPH